MQRNYPYLNDSDFMLEITKMKHIVCYIKGILLDWEQNPIKDIIGKVTSGLINIDGNSSVRRTGNITFVMEQNDEDAAALIQLNKKIYIQVGYQNSTQMYTSYPIVWFPLGLYIITGLSFNHASDATSISIEIKDKMVLLNGQFGGILPASTDFHVTEVQNPDGSITEVHPTIYQIITELVNHFGGQQLGNIIISDIDTRVRQAMQWLGDTPLFVLKTHDGMSYFMTTNQVQANQMLDANDSSWTQEIGSPFQKGANVGFILTDFIYPGELVGNAGQSVVSVLDRIKETLGNFEYFYDINGHFCFQEIKNYLNNTQSKYLIESLQKESKVFIPDNPDFIGEAYLIKRFNKKSVFSFKENKDLVISYSNNPNISAIKNDFIIWGLRKTSSGQQYPIRYHLVIDKKPQAGNTYSNVIKYVDMQDEKTQKWYRPIQCGNAVSLDVGKPGQIYHTKAGDVDHYYVWKEVNGLTQFVEIDVEAQSVTTTDWRTELYLQGVVSQPYGVDSNYYYTELKNEWPKIYDIENKCFRQEIVEDPTQMDYYLDFIDPTSDAMKKICVDNIGRRMSIINKNSDVNCVFEPYIPEVIIIKNNFSSSNQAVQVQDIIEIDTDMKNLRDECVTNGYTYTQVNESIYNVLTQGIGFNSGYEQMKLSLYKYLNYSESINLQTLPIYFLEPNVCIEVQDKDSFINEYYIINSLSFSFDTSSNLSISASKILNRF